jgi:hypothetical protein
MSLIAIGKFAEIENLVYSIVIGDGYVTKCGSICFNHSVIQEEYAQWKKRRLMEMGMKFRKDAYCEPRGFGKNRTIRITSSSNARGRELRKMFYPEGKKIIPSEVFASLGWEGWAIVFQDDGRCNRISHYNQTKNGKRIRVECEPAVNRYEFCFPEFNDREMGDSIASLAKLGVRARIGFHHRLGQRLLWIADVRSKTVFRSGVMPFMNPCLMYKVLPLPSLRAIAA